MLEGVGAPNAVNWCEANLLKLFVHYARDDASGASLQKAGRGRLSMRTMRLLVLLRRLGSLLLAW